MNVCIYGAGAIGGWLGGALASAGCNVSLVARGVTLEALQQQGLGVQQAGKHTQHRLACSADPAELGPQDLVVLAVKAPALPEVVKNIAPLIGPNTLVLCAMNGVPWWFLQDFGAALSGTRLQSVDPEGSIAAAIPAAQIMGCVVHASCSLDGPAQVRHHFGNKLIIGEPAGGQSQRGRDLAALLSRAGFEAPLSEQIQKDVWFKLWGNMTMNPISALTGANIDRILDDELVAGLIRSVMLEAKEIGARMGIAIDQTPEERLAITRKLGAVKTSMLQDVEASRPLELDALVSAVRELGQLTSVATPFTNALLGLTRLKARTLGLYPLAQA
ncbi:2-dehydropantoate 2-reductase [Polaromonas vacuolata]|uniref:2-dehydropantoate 2-reductase n=1 Tax=Polaromonas vacuolata TaxID=37448 RepID=A0A6H2H5Q7_9BURK|nr:2-dehydropantoate 2-reductase [Polaromonas vacuolata]QJC54836.1 2-dehydropantoate 2-reductase [Polaromonas vacuolata]